MVTPALSRNGGGIFTAVAAMSRSLTALPETAVCVFGPSDEFTGRDRREPAPAPVAPCTVWGPHGFGYAPSLLPRMRAWGADLVHAHGLWMYPSVASRLWSGGNGRPHVVSPHGMLDPWALRNSGWKKRAAGWLFESGHLATSACLHALNQSEANSIRRFGLRNAICVLPNGVDLPDAPSAAPAPWADSIPHGSRAMLYLGRIHPKKGLAELLQGWAQARRGDPSSSSSWHLIVAGWDQGQRAALERLSADLGIAGSVRFHGPLFGSAKAAAFSNAQAFVMPSFSEGLPVTVLEAWSYGLPVLMTAECNLPEGFAASAALRIEAHPDSIARTLIEFFRSPEEERIRCGDAGRRLVERSFAWPRIAHQLRLVYGWLLGGGSTPDCVIQ